MKRTRWRRWRSRREKRQAWVLRRVSDLWLTHLDPAIVSHITEVVMQQSPVFARLARPVGMSEQRTFQIPGRSPLVGVDPAEPGTDRTVVGYGIAKEYFVPDPDGYYGE